ncbi:MAG TPA: 2-phosphosulfolactate phosphatase [Candidatus Methylomirabilis sp.]|nr:2-phosphosulfolactate phosphatase [Candidatus Methylomirabilis sp.]
MRVQVALTPAEASGLALEGRSAIVVDVLRATTTVVAACSAGCIQVIPVADPGEAQKRARQFLPGEVLLAGERGGEPIAGFHLGNSPLEFTAGRVRGKNILLTTTNGTAAMLTASRASAAAVAALTNVSAAAGWARARGRDLVVLCSGDDGAFSIEDTVCAGLLISRLSEAGVDLSDGAVAALGLGQHYASRLDDLRHASRWARRLARMGRSADVDACLRQDATDMVPVLEQGAVVPFATTLGSESRLAGRAAEETRDGMGATSRAFSSPVGGREADPSRKDPAP